MTQTDYDKKLVGAYNIMACRTDAPMVNDATEITGEFCYAFRQGYEYGKRLSTTDHERNLLALGDEYAISVLEAKERGFKKFNLSPSSLSTADAYERGWRDADHFDMAWIKAHPKDLLDRILDEYPDMIENEVKARMKDLQNEQSDHSAEERKKVRMEIAMRAMQGLIANWLKAR